MDSLKAKNEQLIKQNRNLESLIEKNKVEVDVQKKLVQFGRDRNADMLNTYGNYPFQFLEIYKYKLKSYLFFQLEEFEKKQFIELAIKTLQIFKTEILEGTYIAGTKIAISKNYPILVEQAFVDQLRE